MNKNLPSLFIFVLVLSLFKPGRAAAAWVEGGGAESVECSEELFGSTFERKVWQNGKDVVVICSDVPTRHGREFVLKEHFQIVAILNGKRQVIAIEKEAGAKPKRILFHDENMEMITYLGTDGPALYRQRISCISGGCDVSEKSCLLAHSENAGRFLSGFDTAISKAGSKSKLSVWQKYFIEGANVKAGETILHEAMLGSDKARHAVLAEVDFDSDAEALRDGLAEDIEAARSVCGSRATR